MKKTLSIFLVISIIFAGIFSVNIYAADPDYTAIAVKGTPVFGETPDAIWENVPEYYSDVLKDGYDTESSAVFKVMWDDSKLYFLVDVTDETYNFPAVGWDGDAVEIFLTSTADTLEYTEGVDGGIGILATGEYFEAANAISEEKIVSMAVQTEKGYIVQCSVDLGISFKSGDELGLEVQIDDCAEEESPSRSGAYGWADGSNQAWQNPDFLGVLQLADKAPEKTPTPTKTPAPTPTSASPANTANPTDFSTPSSTVSGENENTENSNTVLYVALGILAVAIIAGAAILIIKKSGKKIK